MAPSARVPPPPLDDGLASLRLVVGVEVLSEGRARGDTSTGGVERRGLFGGQMVAQALSSCAHTVSEGSVPDSIHINFLGASQSGTPIDFHVERVRDGRALQHRDVRGYQDGQAILHASVVSSGPSPGLDWQLVSMPGVGGPDTSPLAPTPWAQGLGRGLFEVVHPVGDPGGRSFPLWIRSTVAVEDEWLRSATVAYWSDFGMNWSARETHDGLAGAVSSVSATHGLWFHRRAQPDRWHLFDVQTHSFSGNQSFVRASLFDADGGLVASVDQGVFIRRAGV
jgi:acyl-CoA thioesterase II